MGDEHLRRLSANELFKKSLERTRMMVYANESLQSRGNAIHDLHKIAFEVAVLYSPNVFTSVKPKTYLENLIHSADLGLVYVDNLLKALNNSTVKVKRKDLVIKSLNSMRSTLSSLKESASSLLNGDAPPKAKQLLSLNASLKKVRRAYFRMRPKLDAIEKQITFENYNSHKFIDDLIKE